MTLSARSKNNGQEVSQAAEAGEHSGCQVDFVQTWMLVLRQVTEGVSIGIVDHDAYGRQVEHRGEHVVRQVGARPAIPSQQRHEVLLVQQGEEEKGQGEEPKEDSDEQHEVDRPPVFVGGDGDPQAGSEHDLQDPRNSHKTPEELQDVPPHLRLGRLGWHRSLSSSGHSRSTFSRTGRVLFCQLQTAGEKMGKV